MAEQQTGIKSFTKKKVTAAKERVFDEEKAVSKPVSKPKPKFKLN